MPEYLSPGVYVEEFKIGARPMEGVSTSTVGFLGETEYGPTKPTFITSWLQYMRVYGSHFNKPKMNPYLPFAVEGFFANGGKRCYVTRIVAKGAAKATGKLKSGTDNCFTVTTVGEGTWGNGIGIKVEKSEEPKSFNLKVYYWKSGAIDDKEPDKTATIIEEFVDVSIDSTSDNYYDLTVNGASSFIEISVGTGDNSIKVPDKPDKVTALEKGKDGTKEADLDDYKGNDKLGERTGLNALAEIDDISIIYAPNSANVTNLTSTLITHCEELKYRFAIVDSEINLTDMSKIKPKDGSDVRSSEYTAYYYPWIKVYDPLTKKNKLVPPGGHVAGIYARSDTERGVHKAPANEIIRGASEIEFTISKGEQDLLNPRGVNCIRAFPGRGIRVWGARTLASNSLWKYVNVRRLFIFLEHSIFKGTQWVVFEPNDIPLWSRVIQTINQFLTDVWRSGALAGATPDEAFFIKCDRSTMSQGDIDNGRLICIIGVAPVKPAEFVIFRIAQWTGGAKK